MVQNTTRRKDWKYLVYFIQRSKIYRGHFLQKGKDRSRKGNKLFSASSGDGVKAIILVAGREPELKYYEITLLVRVVKHEINGTEWCWASSTGIFQKNLNRNKIVGLGSCNATERCFEKSSNLRFPVLLWNQWTGSVTEMTTWKYRHYREI